VIIPCLEVAEALHGHFANTCAIRSVDERDVRLLDREMLTSAGDAETDLDCKFVGGYNVKVRVDRCRVYHDILV
jgi:hypothetical protein